MRLLGTGAAGIRAQQMAIDTIGNNIANVNTLGYKEGQVDFAEALATGTQTADQKFTGNKSINTGVGAGVLTNGIGTNFQQGTLAPTDSPLDLGIDGAGFFQVKTADGTTAYTRAGNFQLDGTGQLADMQGNLLQPNITVPAGATDIKVSANGEVTGDVAGASTTIGQISLVGFQNPEGLEKKADNLYAATVNSGAPQVGRPGSTLGALTLGTIRGQSLEQSNVDLAASMTDLIQAQRAYQLNARLISDGDQMWGIANTIRR
ncbi:flagellar hook-basal body protein [Desulfosporosinus acidiphilus SJ4]|uniref:Flagellar hook-basal body protein n=1 Tax=Desulfosporosinus acidiphilus (strain DSM 22704 / JCM 16185 / SJ4) TaxID=646529 RepID=I4DA58_DESAJ|nr:flagellar hook-basal body complex protein [Desulfosporosinus acidiphilus]AFM42682.1 flagellar hook-basal body protein [Desulfosporosinus acidiphilus SJ4]